MGTYNNSVDELVDVIWYALDEVEGDFDRATLRAALKKCRGYSPTTDDKFVEPVLWKPWTWCQGYWRPIRLNARLKTRLKETVYLQQRERLVEALKEAMGEVNHLGAEYSKLKRKYEPPYVEYLSHSRPLGFRVLKGVGEEV